MIRLPLVLWTILFVTSSYGQVSYQEHIELGDVHWLRDIDKALEESKKSDKPIFLLFQEVPGCATCRNYGSDVLSDPLIVDAIENEFIPLCVFNNRGGRDKKVLDQFSEPSWNNPVVRIINSNGNDVISRLSGGYTQASVVLQMSLALKQFGNGSPQYLELYKEELTSDNLETAYYQMYCFWSGEAHLGKLDGIVSTEPGWMNGAEVVKVVFDKDDINKSTLDKHANKASCKPVSSSDDYRSDKDLQYYLKNSKYSTLALSALQKTKINSALSLKIDAEQYLSPSQLACLSSKCQGNMIYHLPLTEAWQIMSKK